MSCTSCVSPIIIPHNTADNPSGNISNNVDWIALGRDQCITYSSGVGRFTPYQFVFIFIFNLCVVVVVHDRIRCRAGVLDMKEKNRRISETESYRISAWLVGASDSSASSQRTKEDEATEIAQQKVATLTVHFRSKQRRQQRFDAQAHSHMGLLLWY